MHTPGPWRCVPTERGEYYTHRIEITEGHIASIVGWPVDGTVCPTTSANARLIEHAPDLAAALSDVLAWADFTGGWDATCWERARSALRQATGSPDPRPAKPLITAADLIEGAGRGQSGNDETRLSLLLDFLALETGHDARLADRLCEHLQVAACTPVVTPEDGP